MLKKIGQAILYGLFLMVAVLLLLELSYRSYWFDFYQNNLLLLNPEESLNTKKDSTLLVLGDSFSADPKGYVNQLREVLPNHQIINAAVPGTCVRQHALQFPSRIKAFPPDLFIYQIYVGNDLLEWRHPLQSPDISRLRKIYWWLADQFSVLAYINAKLPQLRQSIYHDLPTTIPPKSMDNFSLQGYSSRSKMHFRAEPNLLDQTVLLQGARKKDLIEVTEAIKKMIVQLNPNCKTLILPIPHCVQLGDPYVNRMQQIGAVITADAITQDDYPFFSYLQQQLANERVQVLNPLPFLRQQDSIQAVYYPNDPHLNPSGHEIIRQQILEKWLK